jgi:hypothetical protein
MKSKNGRMFAFAGLLGFWISMPSGVLCLSISPSYAAVIGVDSASALGANDAIGWGQLNLPAGQAVQFYTGPVSVVSINGNGATVSVGGDNMFYRVDQWPGGDFYGDFPPGMQLIDPWHNYQGIEIRFDQPVYGGGAQVEAGVYGAYTFIVTAFSGAHQLGTYSVAGTTLTFGSNVFDARFDVVEPLSVPSSSEFDWHWPAVETLFGSLPIELLIGVLDVRRDAFASAKAAFGSWD